MFTVLMSDGDSKLDCTNDVTSTPVIVAPAGTLAPNPERKISSDVADAPSVTEDATPSTSANVAGSDEEKLSVPTVLVAKLVGESAPLFSAIPLEQIRTDAISRAANQ
jgi:hypothetical protein